MRPFLLALASTLLILPAAQAQTTAGAPAPARAAAPAPNFTTPAGLATTIHDAERTQNANGLVLAYGQSTTDPQMALAALGQLLADFYTLRNMAQTPEQAVQAVEETSLRIQIFQAAQNQVIIQQNQRIIELLERQTRSSAPAGRTK